MGACVVCEPVVGPRPSMWPVIGTSEALLLLEREPNAHTHTTRHATHTHVCVCACACDESSECAGNKNQDYIICISLYLYLNIDREREREREIGNRRRLVGGSSSSSIVSARDVCSGCVGSHTEWQTRDKLVVYVCVCVCCVCVVVVVGGTLLPAATLYYIYIHTYIHTYTTITTTTTTTVGTWLILPVVICLSQRLSHACLSISLFIRRDCGWLIKSVIVYLMVSFVFFYLLG